jgi:DNA-binding CsgD family transcriptional regulator
MTTAAWMRSSETVTRYLETTTTLATSEKAEEVIKLFENIHLLFPQWAILTCPAMHPRIRYASNNCSEVFGLDLETLSQQLLVEQFFTHVHDDDQHDMYDCYDWFYNYLKTVPPEEHQDIRGVIHYRFRTTAGHYIHLHDEKACIALHGGAKFYYALFQDVSDKRPFTGVSVEIYRRSQQMKKIMVYKPSLQRNMLSKRETELVSLIRRGLSTKEIGYYLNISPNTVRNIKSRLFEKYGVANSIELLNMTA